MKTGKRILTILLTLCVVFTMMPLADIAGMTAYAADGKGVEGEYLDVPTKFDKEIDISKVTGDIVINDSKTYRIYSSEKKTVNHKIKIQKPTLKNIEPHVFIDGISIYRYANLFVQHVNFIVRHREMTTPLLVEHLLDTTTYGVYHIEVYHCTAKTFISEMPLRTFGLQCLLQSAWNETTSVGIIQPSGILHKIDALL